jgi:hypothetical protein
MLRNLNAAFDKKIVVDRTVIDWLPSDHHGGLGFTRIHIGRSVDDCVAKNSEANARESAAATRIIIE